MRFTQCALFKSPSFIIRGCRARRFSNSQTADCDASLADQSYFANRRRSTVGPGVAMSKRATVRFSDALKM
jgi:hypothetical protein